MAAALPRSTRGRIRRPVDISNTFTWAFWIIFSSTMISGESYFCVDIQIPNQELACITESNSHVSATGLWFTKAPFVNFSIAHISDILKVSVKIHIHILPFIFYHSSAVATPVKHNRGIHLLNNVSINMNNLEIRKEFVTIILAEIIWLFTWCDNWYWKYSIRSFISCFPTGEAHWSYWWKH